MRQTTRHRRLELSSSLLFVAVLCLNLLPLGWRHADAQSRQGYRLSDTHITVDTPEHWKNWGLPVHAVDVSPAGEVKPHFFRDRYNVLDDQETFTQPLPDFKLKKNQTAILNVDSTEKIDVKGNVITKKVKGELVPLYGHFLRPGISRVGSNLAAADNILDGDPTTYWEPDPDDPLDEWWIEIDLGRVVAVDEIVLNFVGEEVGDPFWRFRVLAAPDQEPIHEDGAEIAYSLAGGTSAPNRDQRVFSFPLEQLSADPNWTGRLVQTIRIVVVDSRGRRGTLVSEAEWQELDPDDRGDIVYYIKDQQGFEERLDQERLVEPVESFYNNLSPERQGRREFYLRERPRLADVEVWGYGDNISPGIINGGGSLFLTGGNFAPGPGFDANFSTHFLHLVWAPTQDRGVLTVDMGAAFFLDAFRVSTGGRRIFLDGYIVRGSDGSRDSNGLLQWSRISPPEREDNSVDRFRNMLDYYDGIKLRFLELTVVSVDPARRGGYNTGADIAEYQLFSGGYPAEVELTSDLIELPAARNFGNITWEGDTPPGATFEIRTRTGDLLGKTTRFFDKSGNEITASAWDGLLGSYKGPADTSYVPTSGWSSWSRPYQNSGDRVTSPGLRKYMQVQVRMTTKDRQAAASVRSIGIGLLDPVAEKVLAELWPAEVKVAGQADTFDVFIQPNFIEEPRASRSVGFDEILLSMPASQSMQILELGLGLGDEEDIFVPSNAPGIFTNEAGEELHILRDRADSIWVRFPTSLNILSDVPRVYNRITVEGDQVPVSKDGLALTDIGFGLLEQEEQGDVIFFRRDLDAAGNEIFSEVSRSVYLDLEEEARGPSRYFRILRGDGAQFPFDAKGDFLDATAYRQLPSSSRGMVIGAGAIMRLRFSAPVFVNGTTLEMAVRNTAGGTLADAPWQSIEPGDASALVASNSLSINVPLGGQTIDEFDLNPNPFTPNGDGINDEIEIGFSIFKITVPRKVTVRVYTLDGRSVWRNDQILESGRETIRWNGLDDGGSLVPPGLYLCQIEIDADDEGQSATRSRLLSVAY
jgi:hypothetical protein